MKAKATKFPGLIEKVFGWILSGLTAEFLLNIFSNGATVIVLRTIWTSGLIFWSAHHLETKMPTRATVDYVPWLGAIAAAVYAAFYSRFSSQWTYLANLFNQIKQLEVELQKETTVEPPKNVCQFRVLAGLRAAFIEDANTLHLAGHKSFKYAVATWSKPPCVIQEFVGSFDGERKKLRSIMGTAEGATGTKARAPLVCHAFQGYVVSTEADKNDQCSGFRDLRDVLADGRPQPRSA